MSDDQIAAQTEAIREATAGAAKLEASTERLIEIVSEKARTEGGVAGAEQSTIQISEAVFQARAAAQRVVLRFMAGTAVFVAVGLTIPHGSVGRTVFIGLSLLASAGLLARSAH